MAAMKVKNLRTGEKAEIVLKVQNLQIKKTTANAEYASFIGFDGTDLLEVKIWAFTESMKEMLKNGEIYVFSGTVKDYQGKNQLNVTEMREIDLSENIDTSVFYESARLTIEELQKAISSYILMINNKILKEVTLKVLKKYLRDYFEYPAAVTVHHNYISGLAYHVYSMLELSKGYLNLYKYLNKDLVFAGIILHDIGKVQELSGSKGTEYTKAGNLLGHIAIGANMVARTCEELGYGDTEEALCLQHIILSHHGILEYGSPKEPLIPEAALIYLLDFSDSRMAGLEKGTKNIEKGSYTEPIMAFDRHMFYIPNINEN